MQAMQWLKHPASGIKGNAYNDKTFNGVSEENCKKLCEDEISFICVTIDTSSSVCQLSSYYKDLSDNNYIQLNNYNHFERVSLPRIDRVDSIFGKRSYTAAVYGAPTLVIDILIENHAIWCNSNFNEVIDLRSVYYMSSFTLFFVRLERSIGGTYIVNLSINL
ncbi:hypothetical protein CAPTEDRAFT_210754 [Capitella teleta]|uniref:Apple domain-containing protein n=1 Tax=Capitella teleta TaxID=283909 RepID=R7V5N4_CAPTE|nr:hypothetical protein CAPTEDRAFT_210754 [Capitella teleta]|eukprot:ELU13772.1 hypothetical protein CAPTEDRAFT_210754 [Capitella teleta]